MQIFPRLVAAARNCGQLPDPKQDILSAPSAEGSCAGLVASVTDKGTFWVCSPFTKGQLGECLSCSDLYRVKRGSLLKSKAEARTLPVLYTHLKSYSYVFCAGDGEGGSGRSKSWNGIQGLEYAEQKYFTTQLYCYPQLNLALHDYSISFNHSQCLHCPCYGHLSLAEILTLIEYIVESVLECKS